MAAAQDQVPVLIVGACTTGLTLACALAQRGVTFRLIEKKDAIARTSRAVGIHARSLEAFADLGLEEDVYALGEPLYAMNTIVDGQRLSRQRFPKLDRSFPVNVTLPQYQTEELLERHLNALGGRVERSTALVALEERASGVRATLTAPGGGTDTVDASWVVGCDGAHSKVRHLNHQHFPGEVEAKSYVIADVVLDGNAPRNELWMALSDHGMFFGTPLPGNRFQVAADWPDGEDAPATPTTADIQAIVDERSGIKATVRDTGWTSAYHVHYRLTPHYRHGRTFLAGDAAHIHSPFGGRGMNCGILDAYNLAWKLALVVEGKAPALLLDTYETERRPAAQANIAWTKATSASFVDYQAMPPDKRQMLLTALRAEKPYEDRVKAYRHAIEVDFVYPHNVACRQSIRDLTKHEQFCGGPEPGAIATGTEVLERDGARLVFDDILRGPHFTLLGFVGEDSNRASADALGEIVSEFSERFGDTLNAYLVIPNGADRFDHRNTLVDVDGRLHTRFGCADAGVYLIRPDGRVGFRNQPPSLVALRSYLDRVLSCAPAFGHAVNA